MAEENKPKIEQEDNNPTPKNVTEPLNKASAQVTIEDLTKLREYMDEKFKKYFDRRPLENKTESKPKKQEPQVPVVEKVADRKKDTAINSKNVVDNIYIG